MASENIDADMVVLRNRIAGELEEIEEQLSVLRERQAKLRQALRGLDTALDLDDTRPRGFEAVAMVAMDAIILGAEREVDGALTVPEIVEELRRRGWMPDSDNPESAVRASIRRLRDRDPRWGLHYGRLYYHDFAQPSEDPDDDDTTDLDGLYD